MTGKTMIGYVPYTQKSVQPREFDMPVPKKGQVLLKIAYCAMCATDVHRLEGTIGEADKNTIIGHECSGVVVEIGPDTEHMGFCVGDRVVVDPNRYCHYCSACKKDHKCTEMTVKTRGHGCFAEYAVCDVESCHKIPDSLSLRRAVLTEPLTSVMRAMDLAAIKQGQQVLLSGAGGIGMILLWAIKHAGGSNITVIEPVEEKWDLCKKLGAVTCINPFKENIYERCMELTGGEGFDHVFEVSGARSAAPVCLDVLAFGGCATYFAVYATDYELPVNLNRLYTKEGRIQTVFTHRTNFPRAVNFLSTCDDVVEEIIGFEGKFMEMDKAFEAFYTSKYSKVIIKVAEDL